MTRQLTEITVDTDDKPTVNLAEYLVLYRGVTTVRLMLLFYLLYFTECLLTHKSRQQYRRHSATFSNFSFFALAIDYCNRQNRYLSMCCSTVAGHTWPRPYRPRLAINQHWRAGSNHTHTVAPCDVRACYCVILNDPCY